MKLLNRKDEQGFYPAKTNENTYNLLFDGWFIRLRQLKETIEVQKDDGTPQHYEADTLPRVFKAIRAVAVTIFVVCCLCLGLLMFIDMFFAYNISEAFREVVAILALIGLPVSVVLVLLIFGVQALIKKYAGHKRDNS